MTKRFLSLMAMVGIVAMMMLSSCDTANTDSDDNANVSLIGTWESQGQTIEITTDDEIIVNIDSVEQGETVVVRFEGTIKSISGNVITYEYSEPGSYIFHTASMKYSNLTANSVEFDGATYKRVN